jgi:4-hydroxy-3-methylbut-2-enyl diphosphate reductase
VQQVIVRLRELGALSIRHMEGVVEAVHFPLPRGLGDRSMAESAAAAQNSPPPVPKSAAPGP